MNMHLADIASRARISVHCMLQLASRLSHVRPDTCSPTEMMIDRDLSFRVRSLADVHDPWVDVVGADVEAESGNSRAC